MTDSLDTEKPPLAVQRVAFALRTAGWVSFWVQLVLAVVATIILLFAIPFALPRATPTGAAPTNAGTGGGVFLAVCGLVVLGYSIYRAFRFTRLSRELRSPANAVRPKKADTIKEVRLTLMSNLAGNAADADRGRSHQRHTASKIFISAASIFRDFDRLEPIYSTVGYICSGLPTLMLASLIS